MFRTTYIKVDAFPVFIYFLINQCFVVVRVHITQIICAGTCKARHGIQFKREYSNVIYFFILYHTFVYGVPSPFGSMSQRWFSGFGRKEFGNFRQFKRQTAFIDHIRHSILVVNRERFTPVALAGEDSVTKTIIHFYASQIMFFYIALGLFDSFFNGQSVQCKITIRSYIRSRRVANDTFFGIKAFFTDITTFYQRTDFQSEMFGESIVTTIVCRYSHDGTCTITGKYIVTNPDGHCLTSERINGITSGEYTRHAAVSDAIAFSTFLCTFQISVNFVLLLRSSQLGYQFAFRCQHHESNTEHRICTSREDSKFQIAVFYLELYFGTFATADPVPLSFFQRICPVDGIQTVQQALCISRNAKTPLTHLLLNYGETSAFGYTVYHFIVGQNRTQLGTPVYHRFTQIGDAIVHQDFLFLFLALGFPFFGSKAEFFATSHIHTVGTYLLESLYQLFDRAGLLFIIAIIAVEHLLECPLRPMIIFRFARTYFAAPVETETYLIQLLTVSVDIVDRSNCRMLSCLYSILFGGKSVSIISHGI